MAVNRKSRGRKACEQRMEAYLLETISKVSIADEVGLGSRLLRLGSRKDLHVIKNKDLHVTNKLLKPLTFFLSKNSTHREKLKMLLDVRNIK